MVRVSIRTSWVVNFALFRCYRPVIYTRPQRLFVCLFVRTITSERLNVGRSKLAFRCIVQKPRPSSKVKVTRDKKRKTAESPPLTMHSRSCAVSGPYAARSNRRYHCVPPGGDEPRRWENQRMLSSIPEENISG